MTGTQQHELVVRQLLDSYRAIPAGEPVRLAKRTSNLFRDRRTAGDAGLRTDGLSGVLSVDPGRRRAQVQGMCTYESLVAETLPHGLMPMVVPQLRTITIGGAVTGLGIESSSFRHGLAHESVVELDILTGAGEVVTARPDGPHADLFAAFPNSYGSLGYATRLEIELMPIAPHVRTTNVRFHDPGSAMQAIDEICRTRTWQGEPVDFLDGVMFGLDELYLVVAQNDWEPGGPVGDYTGQRIYYRSLRERPNDRLTGHDYLWRWDTDWFWCSRAFGAQHPALRRVWPARWRRSDFYHRIVRWENRFGYVAKVDGWRGLPPTERVVQDVELDVHRTEEFLRWFAAHVGMSPVWLCPLRLREPDGPGSARTWPLYPMEPGPTYVNVGFWGTNPIPAGGADGDFNRAIEAEVQALGGHKSLYSDVYYDRGTFDRLYGGPDYADVKRRYDPHGRLKGLFEKVVGA